MNRISLILLVVLALIVEQCTIVRGCHAGHTQTTTIEETGDTDDYDYTYSDYDSIFNTTQSTRRRRKREVEQFGDDFAILRRYFRDCLFDRVPVIWDWTSVVDFTILKTLWFFYSGTIECTEGSGKDTADCWKACVDVYLRNTSALIEPTKQCVNQYEIDFRKNISVYRRRPRTFDSNRPAKSSPYTECVQAQYNEADPNGLTEDTGFSQVTVETSLDIRSLVDFVQNHVLCVICDFSPLPMAQIRPDPKTNIIIGKNEIIDGSIVYTTTWPFGFEALIRKDARLRYAIHFCNNELEGTFRRDPPPSLGWTKWYTWGVCNARCGVPGSQRRQRVCLDTTTPNCRGPKMESRVCYNRNCAHWSVWSKYTPCVSTCDLSVRYSFRFCVKGKYGDVGCQGERERTKSCAISSCPVPWSSWSMCSSTCGNGVQYRSGGESVMKVRTETRNCKVKNCPQKWSQWSPWGPCSKTCGVNGIRERVRRCESSVPCNGPTRQISRCSSALSPCQDTWGAWTRWSSCNYQMRTRVCYGMGRCVGMADDYKKCSINRDMKTYHSLQGIHQWSGWSMWSGCDKTCGQGKRSRSRICGESSAIPVNSCVGKSFQYMLCKMRKCVSSGASLCSNHYIVDKICYKNRINCVGEIGRRFCKKTCGFC